MDEVLRIVVWVLGGVFVGTVAVFAFWRMRAIFRVWRAPKRPLRSVQTMIWRDPGDVSGLDLAAGPGGRDGRPAPPFAFLEEHLTGSQPCVSVRDGRGCVWRVKWGAEVNVEALATRLAWAAGYFVEITIPLSARASSGLKIVMMWLSNWDAKDVRDVARGSNTAIFEYPLRSGFREARYLIIDWGGALGQWGTVVRRGRWDCHALAVESDAFVTGVDGEFIRFGHRPADG